MGTLRDWFSWAPSWMCTEHPKAEAVLPVSSASERPVPAPKSQAKNEASPPVPPPPADTELPEYEEATDLDKKLRARVLSGVEIDCEAAVQEASARMAADEVSMEERLIQETSGGHQQSRPSRDASGPGRLKGYYDKFHLETDENAGALDSDDDIDQNYEDILLKASHKLKKAVAQASKNEFRRDKEGRDGEKHAEHEELVNLSIAQQGHNTFNSSMSFGGGGSRTWGLGEDTADLSRSNPTLGVSALGSSGLNSTSQSSVPVRQFSAEIALAEDNEEEEDIEDVSDDADVAKKEKRAAQIDKKYSKADVRGRMQQIMDDMRDRGEELPPNYFAMEPGAVSNTDTHTPHAPPKRKKKGTKTKAEEELDEYKRIMVEKLQAISGGPLAPQELERLMAKDNPSRAVREGIGRYHKKCVELGMPYAFPGKGDQDMGMDAAKSSKFSRMSEVLLDAAQAPLTSSQLQGVKPPAA